MQQAAENGLDWFSKDLIEILPAAVYVCDMDAVVVAFNSRAAELWGRTPRDGDTDEKFCGAHRLFLTDGTLLPHHNLPIDQVLKRGVPARDQEVVIERPDGSRVTVLVNIAPIFQKDGAQIGAVNCFQDLSRLKGSEQVRVDLREELFQTQKMAAMGQLVGGVAHDFNNLLTPILGSLDLLLKRGTRDAREVRLLQGALQSAEKAKILVQRLLSFARRQPLQSRAVDVSALIFGMADLIGGTIGPQIEIVIDVARALSSAKVDANQIEMAILNLSINARDAMPNGGTLTIAAANVVIGTGDGTKLEPGEYVRVAVSDSGGGMDKETMLRAIEPFFSTKGIGKGTGLGLSMVDGLVSQLGGALLLTSEVGVGTTVELLLPATSETVEKKQRGAACTEVLESMRRILLVDDEDSVRTSIADMLTDLGYEVVQASSAFEALTLLGQHDRIDGVLTDHLMPGMTGVELARAIFKIRPQTPILIVSGFAESEGLPVDLPLLTKPLRQADLATALGSLLMLESARRNYA